MDQQKKLQEAMEIVGEFPPIPEVANKVMSAVADSSTSADDLRRIIEQDPAIAARILRVANSSLYGFRREVDTLRHAITLLGFRSIECTVMAASLRDVFRNYGLSEKLLLEHATLAGVSAAKLASYGAIDVDRESAFSVGLLHDLGKVALSNAYRSRYTIVMTRTYNEGVAFVDAEREEFGFDHAQLGALIAESWGLPSGLVNAIRFHHHHPKQYSELPPEQFRLTALTSVVTRACTKLGLGRRGPVEAVELLELPAWHSLRLTADDVEPILELVLEEAKAADGIFR